MVDGLVAVVGDKIILKSEVESEYANWIAQGNEADPEMRCIIIDQLLTNKLMLRQAELDSLEVSDEEIEGQIERRMRYFISLALGVEPHEAEGWCGAFIMNMSNLNACRKIKKFKREVAATTRAR